MARHDDRESIDSERTTTSDFEAEAAGTSPGLLAELREFLFQNKKWWLTPIVVVLLLLGLLLLLSGSVIAPFIYPLF